MKVIFNQDVKGKAKKGEMKEVSDGYARNYLIPRGIVTAATADNINTMKLQEKAKKAQLEAEKAQAREIAEMYTVLFSHPLLEAITTWDFNDGCWLKAPSGFVREDNSEKPSYHALKALIHGNWETHETLSTDEEGYVSFTGFRGDYTLKTDAGSSAFSLDTDLCDTLRLTD